MITFHVTYNIVTAESAEDGAYAESGFASPHGWKHDDPSELTLRECLSIVGRGSCEDSGSWFSTVDPDINYRTGEDTRYSVHPPQTVTRASYRRLRRIFCGK